ncbi:nucleosidase [Corynebacterium comes]|uniref:Aminodeoxyfutalosine nucleosidase n=1 Tax=Corynebacterium comes TaxID=2675218 RepID=A0A6B8VJV3_9CORY|nr:nucleosidase [Corynebacterium comes]QGU05662.1 Aminodeoxyfutalosine nucleosidase [Corynebacterium comes]
MTAPLFVAAVAGEAAHLPEGSDVLITGIGTLSAAITLTLTLSERRAAGNLPSRVINIGTAGALRDDHAFGVFEIDRVHKHDFQSAEIPGVTGEALPIAFEPETSGHFPTAQLATGDTFVEDSATRERLAQEAGLVDMEGYAVAAVAHRFGVPVTLLKQISDNADEETASGWAEAVDPGAVQLAKAVRLLADAVVTPA